MRISIGHVTRYTYAAPARYAIQCLRLAPPSFEGQQVINWSIAAPGLENAVKFRDSFGNEAQLVVNSDEHSETLIVARGVVETADHVGVVRGLAEAAPTRVYLRRTPRTEPDEAIRDLAQGLPGNSTIERLHALMDAVYGRIAYIVGATDAHTSGAAALADGKGVCQDQAHVFISVARELNIPSRYVNGYFLDKDAGQAEAHHAWAECWVDGLGWVGFDPTNRQCPTDRYVRLAWGLDAVSAAPIRGTRRGGEAEALDVVVEVQQQSAQQ